MKKQGATKPTVTTLPATPRMLALARVCQRITQKYQPAAA